MKALSLKNLWAAVFGASNLKGAYEGEYYSFSLKNSIAKAKNELEGTIFLRQAKEYSSFGTEEYKITCQD